MFWDQHKKISRRTPFGQNDDHWAWNQLRKYAFQSRFWWCTSEMPVEQKSQGYLQRNHSGLKRSPKWHAAAAAKSLQSCPTLCDPIDGRQPTRLLLPWARTLEWVAISFSNAWKWKVKVKPLSRVRLLATPWTAAYQALPMGFSRQEYWSGVPLPSLPKTLSNKWLLLLLLMLLNYGVGEDCWESLGLQGDPSSPS